MRRPERKAHENGGFRFLLVRHHGGQGQSAPQGRRGDFLGAQLPTLVRGVYYDGWRPADIPVKMSNEEFFARVRSIFPHAVEGGDEKLVRTVLKALERQRMAANGSTSNPGCRTRWPRSCRDPVEEVVSAAQRTEQAYGAPAAPPGSCGHGSGGCHSNIRRRSRRSASGRFLEQALAMLRERLVRGAHEFVQDTF
ncbi:DUF2267 domain-containing protein [Streptomyces flaveolus]|uniref:DUF2267 domain-containing protein n=1 Tax=Streptomyces flaveolus TaxID=67297 RepID=UPI00368034D1